MPAHDLWRKTARGLAPADSAGVPDADLLARFRDARDEAAFELLVYRYGPLVWAACRRMLGDRQAAEDAFQATFLALARRARAVRRGQAVPAWLHRVAVRAALHLRRRAPRTAPPSDPTDPGPGPADRAASADLAAHIDATVNRLPERLRRVVVLCELHGHTLGEAAARLGCPVGTVASRLARARERLRELLSAHGLPVGALGGLTVVELVPPAVRAAATRGAVGGGAGVRPAVAALARRVSAPAPWAAAGLAGSLVLGLGAVALALGVTGQPRPAEQPPAREAPPVAGTRADADGVPLPAGALARVGSARFRTDGSFADLAFSPDGQLIAGASGGRRLTVWETTTGREVAAVRVPEGPFGRVQFTSDGRHLVAGLHRGLHCYEARTGREVFRVGADGFKPDWGPGRMAVDHRWRIGPRDTLFVPGSAGAGVTELRGFELPGGRAAVRVRVPDGAAVLDWNPDGSRLLLSAGGRFVLHDVASGAASWELDAGGPDAHARLTGDGKRVVTREGDRLRVHDVAGRRVVTDVRLPGGKWGPEAGLSLPHDRYAVARPGAPWADHGFVAVDLDRGRVALNLSAPVPGGAASPDGRFLATPGPGAGTSVWDLARPADAPVARLPLGWVLRFSPDGRVLAVDGVGCVTLFDVGGWGLLPQSASPPSSVGAVRFTPDGRGLVGLTWYGWQRWADWAKPEARYLFGNTDGNRSAYTMLSEDMRVAVGITDWTAPASKAADADQLVVRDPRTGRTRTQPLTRGVPTWARHVVLSGDGRRVFAWARKREGEGEVRGWDTATGADLPAWPVAEAPRSATLAVSHDGRWLALFPDPQFEPDASGIRLWDVERGREAGRIRGVSGSGNASYQEAGFSRDGRRLAGVVTNPDEKLWHAVRVWEWRTGRLLMTVPIADFMTAVTLSADGRSCAVADGDGRLRVFEVATGGERAAFRHAARIGSLAFHPDGTRLAASSPEAPVYVWDLSGEPGKWDAGQADAVWAALGSADARAAFAAVRTLRAHPTEAIAFLRARTAPAAGRTVEQVTGWVKGLDAPVFTDRERAQKELAAVADLVRPRLEAARKGASAEAGRRLDQVLNSIGDMTPERARYVRTCEVLEALRSEDAVQLLRAWAAGPDGARLTVEAKESLDRLRP